MAVEAINDEARSLAQFVGQMMDLRPEPGRFFAYRGEANTEWKIVPGIMRDDRAGLLERERDAVRDLVSVHPAEFNHDNTMFDRLVRMQHFGLPTRLMDVTSNPLVALFNATGEHKRVDGRATDGLVYYVSIPNSQRKYYDSDTISCVANLANLSSEEKAELRAFVMPTFELDDDGDLYLSSADRLLQFIRAEKPWFRPLMRPHELSAAWHVIPKLSNRRIIAQSGSFIIFGLSKTPQIGSFETAFDFTAIKIPVEQKETIRADLAKLGITESALFPEIDKAAALIQQRYR